MAWRHHTEIGADRTVHVWPEDDLPHMVEPGDGQCWCEPEMEETEQGTVLVSHRDMLDRMLAEDHPSGFPR